ncbi:MAG: endonuclease/exonuclease/phosphatase family protein [Bacteroidales bacterium]
MGKKATLFLLYGLSIVLTIVLAVLTILALHIGKFLFHENTVTAFIGLLLPILILLNICYFIYWIIRRRWLICLIPLIAVALSYSYVATFYRLGKQPAPALVQQKEATENIRVLTYNTHMFVTRGNPESNSRQLVDFLNTQNIDIACFQEYDNPAKRRDSLAKIFDSFPYSVSNRNNKANKELATYSKYPILDSKYVEYPFSDVGYMQSTIALYPADKIKQQINSAMEKHTLTADSTLHLYRIKDSLTRVITDSLVNLSKKIIVITTHLQTTGVSTTSHEVEKIKSNGQTIANTDVAEIMTIRMGTSYKMRAQQINILAQVIDKAEYPVILCGDFNDTPLSYVYNQAANRLTDGFTESGHGYMYTFRYFKKILRIDYIFHSKDFKSVKYYSPNKEWSDHNPVISELKLL